jgi:hypothetical protein
MLGENVEKAMRVDVSLLTPLGTMNLEIRDEKETLFRLPHPCVINGVTYLIDGTFEIHNVQPMKIVNYIRRGDKFSVRVETQFQLGPVYYTDASPYVRPTKTAMELSDNVLLPLYREWAESDEGRALITQVSHRLLVDRMEKKAWAELERTVEALEAVRNEIARKGAMRPSNYEWITEYLNTLPRG